VVAQMLRCFSSEVSLIQGGDLENISSSLRVSSEIAASISSEPRWPSAALQPPPAVNSFDTGMAAAEAGAGFGPWRAFRDAVLSAAKADAVSDAQDWESVVAIVDASFITDTLATVRTCSTV
jgi:hypothetical protein